MITPHGVTRRDSLAPLGRADGVGLGAGGLDAPVLRRVGLDGAVLLRGLVLRNGARRRAASGRADAPARMRVAMVMLAIVENAGRLPRERLAVKHKILG